MKQKDIATKKVNSNSSRTILGNTSPDAIENNKKNIGNKERTALIPAWV